MCNILFRLFSGACLFLFGGSRLSLNQLVDLHPEGSDQGSDPAAHPIAVLSGFGKEKTFRMGGGIKMGCIFHKIQCVAIINTHSALLFGLLIQLLHLKQHFQCHLHGHHLRGF